MAVKHKYIKFFIFVVLLTIFIFYGINWGTPSVKKTLQIFTSFDELKKYVPIMIELRNKFYSSLKKIHTENNIQTNIQKTYAHSLKSKPFEEIPLEVKLDAIRGYFLGTINSDEQKNIVAVSNMNPLKFDFNPEDFTYGGMYFYTVAVSFLIGKVAGLISLNPDVTHYFSTLKK